jgi:hypothetical protein
MRGYGVVGLVRSALVSGSRLERRHRRGVEVVFWRRMRRTNAPARGKLARFAGRSMFRVRSIHRSAGRCCINRKSCGAAALVATVRVVGRHPVIPPSLTEHPFSLSEAKQAGVSWIQLQGRAGGGSDSTYTHGPGLGAVPSSSWPPLISVFRQGPRSLVVPPHGCTASNSLRAIRLKSRFLSAAESPRAPGCWSVAPRSRITMSLSGADGW